VWHTDTLFISGLCGDSPILLRSIGGVPVVSATDHDYGTVTLSDTESRPVSVKNIGSLAYTLEGFTLHDQYNFSLDSAHSVHLPFTIDPGKEIAMWFRFHPHFVGPYDTRVDWAANYTETYRNDAKPYSELKARGTDSISSKVTQSNISEDELSASINGPMLTLTVQAAGAMLTVELYDLLGRRISIWKDAAISNGKAVLPLPSLSSGMYLVRVGERGCKVIK
jgi:hypothetical protein